MSLRGYCRTLMFFIACKPAMRITKLTTNASTGRLMNRSVNDFMAQLVVWSAAIQGAAVYKPPSFSVRRFVNRRSLSYRRDACASPFLARSRVGWLWVLLKLGRQIVVDRYRHSITQLENARAHNCLPGFQARRDRDKIAASLSDAHELL